MSARRLAGALLLAGAAFLAFAPGALADTPHGAWTDPAPNGTIDDVPVAYLEAPGQLHGYAELASGISGVAFTLVKDAAPPGDPCSAAEAVKPQSVGGGSSRVEFAFDAPFPCNRRYQVRATASPTPRPLSQDKPLALNLWVAVAIPPTPATGVTAEAVGRTVDVRWDAGPHEPDFQGFQVRRSVDGGTLAPVAELPATATSFTDRDIPRDATRVHYEVATMRAGPEANTTVFAASSPTADATLAPIASSGASSGSSTGSGSPGTAPNATVSGGGAVAPTGRGTSSVHRVFQVPGPRRTTNTTVDTGYQEALPFGSAPAGDPSVVASFGDDGDSGQRQTMLLVGAGSLAFSWAMLLRFVTRRAALI